MYSIFLDLETILVQFHECLCFCPKGLHIVLVPTLVQIDHLTLYILEFSCLVDCLGFRVEGKEKGIQSQKTFHKC
jgi:hypothetical protein